MSIRNEGRFNFNSHLLAAQKYLQDNLLIKVSSVTGKSPQKSHLRKTFTIESKIGSPIDDVIIFRPLASRFELEIA